MRYFKHEVLNFVKWLSSDIKVLTFKLKKIIHWLKYLIY